ncbi:MAG TPA: hypothetical protein VFI32_01105 [Rhodanobacteraceae bacterium]|nr:hypothetical protein [Rhodanobacteraceae bacterium]
MLRSKIAGDTHADRAIQQQIENPLAKAILEGQFQPGDTIAVDAAGGRLAFAKRVVTAA